LFHLLPLRYMLDRLVISVHNPISTKDAI
jgi:hypothetical protein